MNKYIPLVLALIVGFAIAAAPGCLTAGEKQEAADAQKQILDAEAKIEELEETNEDLAIEAGKVNAEKAKIAGQIASADAMWKALSRAAGESSPAERPVYQAQLNVVAAQLETLATQSGNADELLGRLDAMGREAKAKAEAARRAITDAELRLDGLAATLDQRAAGVKSALGTIGGIATNAGVPFAGVGVSLLEGALGLAASGTGLAWWNQRKKTTQQHEALRAATAAIATAAPEHKAAVLAKLDEQATDDDHKVLRSIVALDSLPALKIAS